MQCVDYKLIMLTDGDREGVCRGPTDVVDYRGAWTTVGKRFAARLADRCAIVAPRGLRLAALRLR